MTWLICDYGEVLCLPQPTADKAAIVAAAAIAAAAGDFWKAYWRHRPAYDRADISAAEYWESVLGAAPSSPQLLDLVAADTASWLHPNMESIAAIDGLSERGIGLALLSNAPLEVAAGIDAAPWLESFAERFFSCHMKAVKPEPRAYEAVLDALGVAAGDVVFVDDRPANVHGARAVGMRAVLFDGPARLGTLF